jgi:hypothetical protein
MPIQQPPGDMVVAIAEDCGSHSYGVAEYSFCGVAAAVYLRLNLFDNDASPAFNRFHITRSSEFNFVFHGMPVIRTNVRPQKVDGYGS